MKEFALMSELEHPFDSDAGREWIKSHLNIGPMKVTFNKTDGTERTMNCTLNQELTKDYTKKTDRVRKINEGVCPVFDIDIQEWRSFRYDSVIRVQFDL
jgi:hypothetical protein